MKLRDQRHKTQDREEQQVNCSHILLHQGDGYVRCRTCGKCAATVQFLFQTPIMKLTLLLVAITLGALLGFVVGMEVYAFTHFL